MTISFHFAFFQEPFEINVVDFFLITFLYFSNFPKFDIFWNSYFIYILFKKLMCYFIFVFWKKTLAKVYYVI